jgi:tRNA-splicing ligase RtcB (3'-phosphate/5'-hydroxy nucleic acid ligase)
MRVNVVAGRRSTTPPATRKAVVRVLDSPLAPAATPLLEKLGGCVEDADLAAPPVVLPDFCHKHSMEAPSSIAVATRDTIRPTLTSSALNCGMALIALDMDRPGEAAVTDFYHRIRDRYPDPPGYRRDLTAKEVIRYALEGARAAADRYGVDEAELERIEEGGRLDLEPYGGPARAQRELPWLLVQLARMRFGTIGPSTHFVELQEVEEILDPAAELLGLRQGQVTLQYHNGGGVLTGELGRLFGRRKDYPKHVRAIMALQKPLFHLASARSLTELRRRLELYFGHGCPPVARHDGEGNRLMLANAAAMNYGFAYRLATYANLRRFAREALGATSARLVVDSPHNSIYEEEVDGAPAIVHRHNSSRAWPASRLTGHPVFGTTGQPVLLPGTNRTSSYLCVGVDGAELSLYSACHGSGSIIDDLVARGLSGPDPGGRSTLRYSYSDAAPVPAPHLDDQGVDEALGILTSHAIVKPVARLRPFAVLT